MTWLKKDDRFPEHRKIRRLSDGAYRLHDTALCACAKDETDGLLTEDDFEEIRHASRLRQFIPELVQAGLWEPVEGGGWMMHDYLDYNPSHAQLEVERERSRERQRRARERRLGIEPEETPSRDDVSRRESRRESRRMSQGESRSESRCMSQDPDPTRPDPTRPVPKSTTPDGVVVGPRKRGTRLDVDGFTPNSESRAAILESFPQLDLRAEHAKFCDYWTAVPGQRGTKLDWDATWRNWMRRAGEQGRSRPKSRQQETDDMFAAAMQRAQDADAAAARGELTA